MITRRCGTLGKCPSPTPAAPFPPELIYKLHTHICPKSVFPKTEGSNSILRRMLVGWFLTSKPNLKVGFHWKHFAKTIHFFDHKGDILVRGRDGGTLSNTTRHSVLADPSRLWPEGVVEYRFYRTFPRGDIFLVFKFKHLAQICGPWWSRLWTTSQTCFLVSPSCPHRRTAPTMWQYTQKTSVQVS